MSATLSHIIPRASDGRAPDTRTNSNVSHVAKFGSLWKLMLRASETAVRHNYAAPWRTDDSL